MIYYTHVHYAKKGSSVRSALIPLCGRAGLPHATVRVWRLVTCPSCLEFRGRVSS